MPNHSNKPGSQEIPDVQPFLAPFPQEIKTTKRSFFTETDPGTEGTKTMTQSELKLAQTFYSADLWLKTLSFTLILVSRSRKSHITHWSVTWSRPAHVGSFSQGVVSEQFIEVNSWTLNVKVWDFQLPVIENYELYDSCRLTECCFSRETPDRSGHHCFNSHCLYRCSSCIHP